MLSLALLGDYHWVLKSFDFIAPINFSCWTGSTQKEKYRGRWCLVIVLLNLQLIRDPFLPRNTNSSIMKAIHANINPDALFLYYGVCNIQNTWLNNFRNILTKDETLFWRSFHSSEYQITITYSQAVVLRNSKKAHHLMHVYTCISSAKK